jgi:hypothetical protein
MVRKDVYKKEKETKGTVVYGPEDKESPLGVLYVKKTVFENNVYPDKVAIRVDWED